MKTSILFSMFLLGSIQCLYAQNNLHSFDSFLPKCPDEIFTGIILKAESVNDNTYQFVDVPLNPITVSYSFLAQPRTISPSRNNMMKAILEGIQESGSLQQNYSFSYSIRELNSYGELALYTRQATDNSLFFGIPIGYKGKRTLAAVEISQTFFTIDMDMPDALCADPNSLEGYKENQLIYISSISFGRKAILIIESDADYSDVKPAIEYMFKKADGENLQSNPKLESIFINSTTRVMIAGGEEVKDTDPANPLKDLIDYMNRKVTAESFGVPIAFSASYLKDNSMFVNKFSIQ